MSAYAGFLDLWPWLALAVFVCLVGLVHDSRDRSRAQVAAERVATRERLVRCEANENADWRN